MILINMGQNEQFWKVDHDFNCVHIKCVMYIRLTMEDAETKV